MESNLPLGKVWLKTPKNQELKTLVPVTADNMLSWLYILHSKRGECLKIKSFSPFPWAAANSLPAQCPPVQHCPHWAPTSFSSVLRALCGASSREGEFLLVLEWEAEVGEERGQRYSCAVSSFSCSLVLLSACWAQCPWSRVGGLRALQWDLGYPWLSLWCLQLELVQKSSLGFVWLGGSTKTGSGSPPKFLKSFWE